MSSSHRVLIRMDKRIAQLTENFGFYADFFSGSDNFVGPSIYFHNKTLAIRQKCATVEATLQSDEFFDYLYATLTAWGMHRMGQGNTKLGDIEVMKRSFRLQSASIQNLQHLTITNIEKRDASRVAQDLWDVLSQLKVSVAEARIVANSKALHHLLPALVPPIDRTYTYTFFYNRNMLTLEEQEAFQEMYLRLHFVATSNKQQIQARIGTHWNTSETKTLDNAIVGFVLKELRLRQNSSVL